MKKQLVRVVLHFFQILLLGESMGININRKLIVHEKLYTLYFKPVKGLLSICQLAELKYRVKTCLINYTTSNKPHSVLYLILNSFSVYVCVSWFCMIVMRNAFICGFMWSQLKHACSVILLRIIFISRDCNITKQN